ncbi:MAG: DUF4345 domain-containing protein [Chitinophagaceae bacterium]|nr:DUF4345 domain-containing protein [Chitinophagaceae bacterium]
MKIKLLNGISRGFIILSALSLLYVTVLAFFDPRAVMQLVGVTLPNNDAISSIRGVYGGVGLTIVLLLVRCVIRDISLGLLFLCFLWGLYAISRLITSFHEGPLGAFGSQWLMIESIFFLIALALWFGQRRAGTARARGISLGRN